MAQHTLTLYQRRLLIEADGKGYIQVHRYNPTAWQRRRALLKLSQVGVLTLVVPVIGSYLTFSPVKHEGVDTSKVS